jgi:hypothetical protein
VVRVTIQSNQHFAQPRSAQECQRPSVLPKYGHLFLPSGGDDFSPLVAIFSPHLVGGGRVQVRAFTPLPAVAWGEAVAVLRSRAG